jgi:hypothetical protein
MTAAAAAFLFCMGILVGLGLGLMLRWFIDVAVDAFWTN